MRSRIGHFSFNCNRRGALIIATNPALTAVAAWLIFRLRFGWWQWLGVAVAFLGVAIVMSRGDLSTLGSTAIGTGEALMFCGVLSWLVYTLVGRAVAAGDDGVGIGVRAAAAWRRRGVRAAAGSVGAPGRDRSGGDRLHGPLRHRDRVRVVLRGRRAARRGARVGVHEPRAGVWRDARRADPGRAAAGVDISSAGWSRWRG